MSDSLLTIAAATSEVAATVMVLLGVLKARPVRRQAVVVLGALTPAIVCMADLAYVQATVPQPGNMASAGWLMGWVPFVALLLTGVALSYLPRPVNLAARYLLGLGSVVITLALLALG